MPHGWRISCLRDVHLVRDTPDEIAYHACISVAFIVEAIKIARRVAAQPAWRTHTAAAVSKPGRCVSRGQKNPNTQDQVCNRRASSRESFGGGSCYMIPSIFDAERGVNLPRRNTS